MPTASLARFIVNTRFSDLPDSVIEYTKRCFLDWLGSVYAGSTSKPTQIMLDVVKELGGVAEATVIPDDTRSSCIFAAMINAASSHVVEMDDLDKASVLHPAAPIIPAALAVAEREGSSGADLILAVVLGYEAAIRIGEAVNPGHYYFWHTTGTVGTFGAAAASGVLHKLNEKQMIWALGSAGTQASGLWEFLVDGAMSKQLHPAKAAMNGIISALLAKRGFTAAQRILEGDKGFWNATTPTRQLDKITQGLMPGMSDFKIKGVSFKPHASCRHTHPSIDATLSLIKKYGIRPDQIDRVTAKVYSSAMDLLGNVEATTPYSAKFNLPYCVAMAALYGNVGLNRFTEETLREESVGDLMSRVNVEVDPDLDKWYPQKWPARIQIFTTSGDCFEELVEFPKGDPENPLSPTELSTKFRDMASHRLSSDQINKLTDRIFNLESLSKISELWQGI